MSAARFGEKGSEDDKAFVMTKKMELTDDGLYPSDLQRTRRGCCRRQQLRLAQGRLHLFIQFLVRVKNDWTKAQCIALHVSRARVIQLRVAVFRVPTSVGPFLVPWEKFLSLGKNPTKVGTLNAA